MSEETIEVQQNGRRAAIFALAVAVILGAVLFGTNNPDVKTPDLAGTYGSCTVAGGGRGWWAFQCPDQAARSAAINEFAKRNSNYEVLGIVVQEKKK